MKNRIQEVMWLKRITQDDLHKRTGIKQSYLSEIITGQRDVRISTAQKIAKAVGKSMDYLWPY
ncbi:helix-turn-helix transcriptional regulator [Desulfosporosinus sp. OT]|uniref:helix-turn-helix domain-containing protein n=1 Tax=Desulfosporosinus sp. OT TaxID=913865 RepID=UPI000223A512|nr:helix-turn-helix transcriptional regulator [Desulfosporosinus sp. OT]EGW36442.1 helix-turn-helix family protein [Desulfosporosinus sp. OT]